MEIDAELAAQALQGALSEFPEFEPYGPRLEWRPLMRGGAFLVAYKEQPPRDMPRLWDFQNAVVKGYKQLAGVS